VQGVQAHKQWRPFSRSDPGLDCQRAGNTEGQIRHVTVEPQERLPYRTPIVVGGMLSAAAAQAALAVHLGEVLSAGLLAQLQISLVVCNIRLLVWQL